MKKVLSILLSCCLMLFFFDIVHAQFGQENEADQVTAASATGSTFDNDADGWLIVGMQGFNWACPPFYGPTNPTWSGTGGNPGGCIIAGDVYQETLFSAPTKFLGNQSASFGKKLKFDIKITKSDSGVEYPAVVLCGAGKSLFYNAKPTTIGEWTTRTIPLNASGWKLSDWENGPTATNEDMKEVLGSLDGLYIITEWYTGSGDLTSLDNVKITSCFINTALYGPE